MNEWMKKINNDKQVEDKDGKRRSEVEEKLNGNKFQRKLKKISADSLYCVDVTWDERRDRKGGSISQVQWRDMIFMFIYVFIPYHHLPTRFDLMPCRFVCWWENVRCCCFHDLFHHFIQLSQSVADYVPTVAVTASFVWCDGNISPHRQDLFLVHLWDVCR